MKKLLFALLILSTPAWAAHVTDKLVVGFYGQPSTKQRPSRLLPSGTPLEVVKKGEELTKVRLGDGQEGWIETTYVTDNKPAAAMLLEAQARVAELERSLPSASGSCPQPGGPAMAKSTARSDDRIAKLQRDHDSCTAALHASREQMDAVRKLLGMTPAQQASGDQIKPIDVRDWWQRYGVWVVPAVTLLVGFAAGVGFIDYRIRKRYGGFRM